MSINKLAKNFLSNIQRNLVLVPGWRTKKKIIIIESDDWGSIRMPNKEAYLAMTKINAANKSDAMLRYDTLESNDDLEALFDVLNRFRDKNGRPAKLTANTIMANPDFDKIKANQFKEYHYEEFTDTLAKYHNRDKVRALIDEGMYSKVYKPQFHGREHLNVDQWMDLLRIGNQDVSCAFNYQVLGNDIRQGLVKTRNLMSALNFESENQIKSKSAILDEGLEIFKRIFGFNSLTFIATTYVWDTNLEYTLFKNGVKGIQGVSYQGIPMPGESKFKRKFHYTGQKNSFGQVYLVRNAFFEPTIRPNQDWVSDCLKRVQLAFRHGKPAIIGSHRVNFIGSLVEKNRTDNLIKLNQLLSNILKQWPDVVFMSSDELVSEILTQNN